MSLGNAQYYILTTEGDIQGQFASQYHAEQDGRTMPDVIPSEVDGGYYILRPWRKSPSLIGAYVGYEITKVDGTFNALWTKSFFPEKKKEGIFLQKAETGFDRLVVIQSNMRSWIAQTMKNTEMVCFDSENGDELYRVSLYDETYTSLPNQINFDEQGNITLGGEYYAGTKIKVTGSEGVFAMKLDPAGDELGQNRSSWKEGIQRQMKRGNISLSGKNKVIFHDLISTEDGGFQLIGETFSKKQTMGSNSMAGLGMRMLARAAGMEDEDAQKLNEAIDLKNFIIALASGRFIGDPLDLYGKIQTPTILTIQDMLVFDYDDNLELTNVNKVQKAYTKVYAYPPYTTIGGLRLAKIMNNFGFFDYSFTEKSFESGTQTMVYNSMMSKRPHIGVVDIEKGSEAEPKQFVIKNLKKYGGFDAEAQAAEVESEAEASEEQESKPAKMRYSNAGVAKANNGKVVIYYIEKDQKAETGTLKLFHETFNEDI
ncbi:MAG: DUF6770 family protein [Bacteroidota bacterium]